MPFNWTSENRQKYKQSQEWHTAYMRQWKKENPEKARENQRRNDEKRRGTRYSPERFQRNKTKLNVYRRHLYNTDPIFRLRANLYTLFHSYLSRKGITKDLSVMKLIGCSIDELKCHLESKFVPGMTWENRGLKGWHVDHIIPCAAFDLSDPNQQKKCWHYTNLQPLWAKDNILKRDKM